MKNETKKERSFFKSKEELVKEWMQKFHEEQNWQNYKNLKYHTIGHSEDEVTKKTIRVSRKGFWLQVTMDGERLETIEDVTLDAVHSGKD